MAIWGQRQRRSPTAAKTIPLVANGRLVPQHTQATHAWSPFPHPPSRQSWLPSTPLTSPSKLACTLHSARLTLLDSQPHTSLLLLLIIIIMIYGYIQHTCTVPPPSSSPHIDSPPSIRRLHGQHTARSSKRRTLTRTVVQTLFFACDNPWRSVESTVVHRYADVHAENELQAWGTTAPISQRYPSTHRQKKAVGTCAGALPTSASKSTPAAHDSFARRISPGPTPLKLLNLGRADCLQFSVLFYAGEVWIRPSLKCSSTSSSARKKLCATENKKSAVCDKVMIGDSQPCEKRARASTKPLARATRNSL
jgi:hypothetical protein